MVLFLYISCDVLFFFANFYEEIYNGLKDMEQTKANTKLLYEKYKGA